MSTTYKQGIDISQSQGKIDFSALSRAGIDFVLICCGQGGCLLIDDDPYFERNVTECERYGIPWGGYLSSRAINLTQAKAESDRILRLLEGKKPLYPVMLQMEDNDGYKQKQDVSDRTLADICETICRRLEKEGLYTGICSNLYWFTHQLSDGRLDRFDKWLIRWAEKPGYTKPFGIWQNKSRQMVEGIAHPVETDIAYRDYPQLIRSTGRNGW